MNQFNEDVKNFYVRDLYKLAEEIRKIPEKSLWQTVPGVSNSCGVLAQHMIGNLNHYIGFGLADTGYERDREREFTNTGISSEKLITEINETASVINKALDNMDESKLSESFSLYKSDNFTVRQMLLHLYGHFNYHLGQVNYLRRILSEK